MNCMLLLVINIHLSLFPLSLSFSLLLSLLSLPLCLSDLGSSWSPWFTWSSRKKRPSGECTVPKADGMGADWCKGDGQYCLQDSLKRLLSVIAFT